MKSPHSDRIAICGEFFPAHLKHRLLFFDRLGFHKIEAAIKFLRILEIENLNNLANDVEFLLKRDVLFETESWVTQSEALYRRSKKVKAEDEADFRTVELLEVQLSRLEKRIERRIESGKSYSFLRMITL